MRRPVFMLMCLLALGPGQPAWSQAAGGVLAGLVADESGSALPGANIVVRGPDGAVLASTAAGGDGRYRLGCRTSPSSGAR
jgi:hypothetical protein